MRLLSDYEKYLIYLERSYYENNEVAPVWINEALMIYLRLHDTWREYSRMCSDNGISKATMKYLEALSEHPDKYEEYDKEIPEELIKRSKELDDILVAMYKELMAHKDLYFINEWTLTRTGRKKMREYTDRFPCAGGINPPAEYYENKRIENIMY